MLLWNKWWSKKMDLGITVSSVELFDKCILTLVPFPNSARGGQGGWDVGGQRQGRRVGCWRTRRKRRMGCWLGELFPRTTGGAEGRRRRRRNGRMASPHTYLLSWADVCLAQGKNKRQRIQCFGMVPQKWPHKAACNFLCDTK